jgi:hypothetical protein
VSTGPHIPMTTSAGHFLSMQPAVGVEPRTAVWFRGDQFDALRAECDRYRRACELTRTVCQLATRVSNTDAPDPEVLDILDIVEGVLK